MHPEDAVPEPLPLCDLLISVSLSILFPPQQLSVNRDEEFDPCAKCSLEGALRHLFKVRYCAKHLALRDGRKCVAPPPLRVRCSGSSRLQITELLSKDIAQCYSKC